MKKTIAVVAAILRHDGKYFATQRGYGEFEGYWEFPGGKIEPGESEEAALCREIEEELGARILVESKAGVVETDYPQFHLVMHCYFCTFVAAHVELREHKDARWLKSCELREVAWLPADWEIIVQSGMLEEGL